MQTSSPVIPFMLVRPYAHLDAVNPNRGEDGCSTVGGPGLFSMGGDACFNYGMLAHLSGNQQDVSNGWEQFQDAKNSGNYYELDNYNRAQPLAKSNHWIMKDGKRPFSEENLDWDRTHPDFHPYRRTKKQKQSKQAKLDHQISREKSSTQLPIRETASARVAKKVLAESNSHATSSSDFENEDDDGVSISSSEACVERALNGETFEGEYHEESSTSSSGTSSDGSDQDNTSASKDTSSKDTATGTSSPFDALRSSPATNMISDYMSALSPHDESVNLTRSYAVPVRPSKKKPNMRFTPTNQINGINIVSFLDTFLQEDPTSGENIEIDDDEVSVEGPYIEMDLALGVLEKKDEDVAMPSGSSEHSGEERENVDVITRLTNVKTKGKDVKGKKAIIEEM